LSFIKKGKKRPFIKLHWISAKRTLKEIKNSFSMEVRFFKKKVCESLHCKVSFLGKKEIISHITESQFQNIISWLQLIVEKN